MFKKRRGSRSNYRNTPKVEYKGITFGSGLEKYFYILLEDNNLVGEVEVHKEWILHPKFKYGVESIIKQVWKIDFTLERLRIIVDTKGSKFTDERVFLNKVKWFKYLTKDNPYLIFFPRNQEQCRQVIEQIKLKL